MSEDTAHEVSRPDDKRLANSAAGDRRPDPAVVLQALAALEVEFYSVLNRQSPAK
jgi:hypothetical protein